MTKKDNYVKLVLVTSAIFIIFLPYLLSLNSFPFTYSIPGTPEQIATTITGMTAPAIGILTAYLMYEAFRQQRLANEQIQDQLITARDTDILKELISDLKTTHFDLFERIANQPNAPLIITDHGIGLIDKKVVNINLHSYVKSVLVLMKQIEGNKSPLLGYELAKLNHLSGDIFSYHFEHLESILDKRGMGEIEAMKYNATRINEDPVEIKIQFNQYASITETLDKISTIASMMSKMMIGNRPYFEERKISSNL